MKKRIIGSIMVAIVGLVGFCCCSGIESMNVDHLANNVMERHQTEAKEETTNEEEQIKEEQIKEEPKEEETVEEKENTNDESDEESPNEMEDHEEEFTKNDLDDIRMLSQLLADANPNDSYDYNFAFNDIYTTAKTYGVEYALDYANRQIESCKNNQNNNQQQNDILNHIDDWDYACIAYEYMPSSNMVGNHYTLMALDYSSYVEFYFSIPQEERDRLKSLFQGECPSITGMDDFKFKSQISGKGEELKNEIKSAMNN